MGIDKIFAFSGETEVKETSKEEKELTLTEKEVYDILSGGYLDLNEAFRKEALRRAKIILREAKADVMDFRVRYNSSPNLRLELKDTYYDKRDKFIIWDTLMKKVNKELKC